MNFSPTLRLHFIIFLWGFTAIIGKLIMLDSLSMVWCRTAMSVIILFIYGLCSKTLLKISIQTALKFLVVGSIIAIHWYFFFLSIKVSNVSIGLSTISTGALFTAFLEPFFFKRKIKWYEIYLSMIITICMIVLFNAEIQYFEGIIYGLIASILSSLFSVVNGKIVNQSNSITILSYELLGGVIILSCLILWNKTFINLVEISSLDLFYLFILASLFTIYPMLESISLMKFITPFTLILTVNLEPIYGIIFAFFIFGESEQMSTTFYFVSLIMILSIFINKYYKVKKT